MKLGSRRQTSQAKQDLGSVGALLGPEEDNGFAALEGAAAQREQHSLFVPYAAALQAEAMHSELRTCCLTESQRAEGGEGVEGLHSSSRNGPQGG